MEGYTTTSKAGKANVASSGKMKAPKLSPIGSPTANAHVGKGVSTTPKSSGNMVSVPQVTLGTTHGNHNVGHPIKGKSGSH